MRLVLASGEYSNTEHVLLTAALWFPPQLSFSCPELQRVKKSDVGEIQIVWWGGWDGVKIKHETLSLQVKGERRQYRSQQPSLVLLHVCGAETDPCWACGQACWDISLASAQMGFWENTDSNDLSQSNFRVGDVYEKSKNLTWCTAVILTESQRRIGRWRFEKSRAKKLFSFNSRLVLSGAKRCNVVIKTATSSWTPAATLMF